uniref:Putative secreted protein n=1 Tax=Anopheles marajoara TaxID=58244 RepID=A0A2M4CBG2_9DIPT
MISVPWLLLLLQHTLIQLQTPVPMLAGCGFPFDATGPSGARNNLTSIYGLQRFIGHTRSRISKRRRRSSCLRCGTRGVSFLVN